MAIHLFIFRQCKFNFRLEEYEWVITLKIVYNIQLLVIAYCCFIVGTIFKNNKNIIIN